MCEVIQAPKRLMVIGGSQTGQADADQLCASLVQPLTVDGAALTIAVDGADGRSMGASSRRSQQLIDLQFICSEGPSFQAVSCSVPVLAADLHGIEAAPWRKFAAAASTFGVGAIFAWPVKVAGISIGALLLYRNQPGQLSETALTGAHFAAELAAFPILAAIK